MFGHSPLNLILTFGLAEELCGKKWHSMRIGYRMHR